MAMTRRAVLLCAALVLGFVPFAKLHARIEPASLLEHPGRKVDAKNRDSSLVKIACHVTGATANVAHCAAPINAFSKGVKQLTIERLARGQRACMTAADGERARGER